MRVATPDTMHVPPPPYDLVDNQYSILDVTDLVMIDPVGTGLSRPLGDAEGHDFWGVDEDASSLAQFVTRFLGENDRWNSPRYLLGESYGTTRSAALGAVLQGRSNVDLNGIILVSAVLDFQTITFNPGNDIPYFLYLPSYTAVAFYHHALPDQPAQLQPLLDEVEHFAVTEYADALLQGDKLTGQARQEVLQKLHRYTGLSVDYLDAADLRVDNSQFEKELMRETGVVLGRLDARFTGFTEDGVGERADFDPQSASVSSAYASSWNRYLRDELGYDGTRDYRISGNVNPWNWQHGQQRGWPGHTNVAVDLARTMRQNPTLHVMLNSGLHDLATPYFAADYTMDHLGLPPELRGNVERVEYEAGHMMYLYEPALARFKTEVAGFIQRTSDGGGSVTAAN
jgi:carboxypeptidase C (cathepsin A)